MYVVQLRHLECNCDMFLKVDGQWAMAADPETPEEELMDLLSCHRSDTCPNESCTLQLACI